MSSIIATGSTSYSDNFLIFPLIAFHQKCGKLFTALPEKGKIWEVSKRVGTAIIAPLAYLTTALLALVGLAFDNTLRKRAVSTADPSSSPTFVPLPAAKPKDDDIPDTGSPISKPSQKTNSTDDDKHTPQEELNEKFIWLNRAIPGIINGAKISAQSIKLLFAIEVVDADGQTKVTLFEKLIVAEDQKLSTPQLKAEITSLQKPTIPLPDDTRELHLHWAAIVKDCADQFHVIKGKDKKYERVEKNIDSAIVQTALSKTKFKGQNHIDAAGNLI